MKDAEQSKQMILRYEETGEVRPPRLGEWFRGVKGIPQRARFDFSAQLFPILREVFEPSAAKAEGVSS